MIHKAEPGGWENLAKMFQRIHLPVMNKVENWENLRRIHSGQLKQGVPQKRTKEADVIAIAAPRKLQPFGM